MWGLSVAHTNEVNGHCVTDVAMVTPDVDTKKVCLSAGYVNFFNLCGGNCYRKDALLRLLEIKIG